MPPVIPQAYPRYRHPGGIEMSRPLSIATVADRLEVEAGTLRPATTINQPGES